MRLLQENRLYVYIIHELCLRALHIYRDINKYPCGYCNKSGAFLRMTYISIN